MNNEVIILSGNAKSGKTTALQRWLMHQQNVDGILTIEKNGNKYVQPISSSKEILLEAGEQEDGEKVGRFVFSKSVLDFGSDYLVKALELNPEWLVIDEIGPLEIKQYKGWDAAVKHILQSEKLTKLFLVIRASLLDAAIRHYNIPDAKIISSGQLLQQEKPLTGIVLCGGESSRMGEDKAMLQYHNMSQYQFVQKILSNFCDDVYLSVNQRQSAMIEDEKLIVDNEAFRGAGPLTGLLSAAQQLPGKTLLVVGCDYPLLTRQAIFQLVNSDDNNVVCFKNADGFYEPWVAIYSSEFLMVVQQYFMNGGRSVQSFLAQLNINAIAPENPDWIKSFDTPVDYQNYFNHA